MPRRPATSTTRIGRGLAAAAVSFALLALIQGPAGADTQTPPIHLKDRGTGIPTSRFGTYVRSKEWLVEPSLRHSKNRDMEYDPSELGFSPGGTFHGRYEASEGLVFLSYGLSDRVAVEFEAAGIRASLRKAAADSSTMPQKLTESGLGQVRSRLDWRWLAESERRPELYSYAEAVFPHDSDKVLVGTPDWTVNGGIGAIRGFRWGTMTVRLGFEYDTGSETSLDFGEYALEYLKRLSPRVSLYAGYVVFQGDEGVLATEVQWSPGPRVVVKVGNRLGVVSESVLGVTSNSTDWAPSVAVLFKLPAN